MKLRLVKRLERLEAELAPGDDKPALTIVLTSVGQPDQIIDVRGPMPPRQRTQVSFR
jgi:hypothetical protein